MIIDEVFSELFLNLSQILTAAGFSFSTMNLSIRFKNPEIEHISITWNCPNNSIENKVDQPMDMPQLAESILGIAESHFADIRECGLILVSNEYLPNEFIRKNFTRASKNCMRIISRRRGKKVSIQLLGHIMVGQV